MFHSFSHVVRSALTCLAVSAAVSGCTRNSKSQDPLSAANKSSSNDILVGEYGSFSGGEATFGQSTSKGIALAVEEKNNAGGIKGRKIRVVSVDDQGSTDQTVALVNRLITQDRVIALLGEVASTRSLAAAPIAQRNKIPMVTPSSTNPKVTEVGDYIFRVCFIDAFQGLVMARFARENLKKQRVAILRDVKSEYSVGLADVFKREFEARGGKIDGDASYQSGDSDFKGQLTQLKGKNPEAIFIPGYYTEVGLIARQARALGLDIPLLGGDGWDSDKLYEIGKESIKGGYFSNHYTTENTSPAVVEFIEKFKKRYDGKTPDGLSAQGYDAARVLFYAMEKATELTPQSIRDSLAAVKDFPGATGVITIDEHRNARKAAVVVQVDGTVNRFVTTIAP